MKSLAVLPIVLSLSACGYVYTSGTQRVVTPVVSNSCCNTTTYVTRSCCAPVVTRNCCPSSVTRPAVVNGCCGGSYYNSVGYDYSDDYIMEYNTYY